MFKSYTYLLIGLCLSAQLFAQKANLSIYLKDKESHEPIPNAQIRIGKEGGISNAQGLANMGSFAIGSPVEITAIGYQSLRLSLPISQGDWHLEMLPQAQELAEVTVQTGSKSQNRSQSFSSAPIDVLDIQDLQQTGQIGLDKQLQYRLPSFGTANYPVSDAATLLDPYEIRNLGPSRTLILINGKRKNLSALMYLNSNTVRGETGADLSSIPSLSIAKIEVLRDGASAQYGSDALAGVVNIILKNKTEHQLQVSSGFTGKNDGFNWSLAYHGAETIAGKGYFGFTLEMLENQAAYRNGIVDPMGEKASFGGDPHLDARIDAYLKRFPEANNRNGTGSTQALKLGLNWSLPIQANTEWYGFAGLTSKKVNSYANFRPPYWKLDYGLFHQAQPNAPNYSFSDDPLYQGYLGYLPSFNGDLLDAHATLGLKTKRPTWQEDLSITLGHNAQFYTVDQTINHSYLAQSPTSFKPGGYGFGHLVGNYELSRRFSEQWALALGAEVRMEQYQIHAGDTASYKGQGANSFPGILADIAQKNQRFNQGMFLDLSWDAHPQLLINGALRAENYSDFGKALVWKLAGRYGIWKESLVLRTGISTGFKAPNLHQIYTQSYIAGFQDGIIQTLGLFNNKSKQAQQLGIPSLRPEKSLNLHLGLAIKAQANSGITLDYYFIRIKDRMIYSNNISTENPNTALYGILKASNIAAAQFMINGVDSRMQGLDWVAYYQNIGLGSKTLDLHWSGNVQLENKILGKPKNPALLEAVGSSIINAESIAYLTSNKMQYKSILGLDVHLSKSFLAQWNATLFGPTRFQDISNGGDIMNHVEQFFLPAVVHDLSLSYTIKKQISFSLHLNNGLNRGPKWELRALDAQGTAFLHRGAEVQALWNNLTFNGRYPQVSSNGWQFSQLGRCYQFQMNVHF